MLRPGYDLCYVARVRVSARPTSANGGALPGKVLPEFVFVKQN